MTKRFKVLCMVVAALIVCTGTVSAYSGETKNVKVVALDLDQRYETKADTVEELLNEINLVVNNEDYISKAKGERLLNNDIIEIKKAIPVMLSIDSVPKIVYTSRQSVGEVLNDYALELGSSYRLNDSTEKTKVTNKMTIEIITQKETILTETQVIPFETKKIENPDVVKGSEKIVQQGEDGEDKVTLKNKYEGTVLVSSEVAGKVTMKKPIEQIIEVGTKDVPSIEGYAYSREVTMTATGYTKYDPGCNDTTATGTKARRGVVAVDPKVFPYGTKFYIPGYGVGIAEDCGGAIKGNKLDLFYDTKAEAYSWGRRTITVYILE